MISTVCFDLGGVLVRLSSGWQDAAERAGVLRPGAGQDNVAPDAAHDTEELRNARWQIVSAYQAGSLSCAQYYAGLAAVMGAYSARDVELIHAAWILDHYPGVVELVDAINRTPGLKSACLSNTNHAHWQVLTAPGGRYPAIERLHTRLASHELGFNKPDPRIYARALERLGQQAHQVLFFDDLPENVDAARESGWHAELIDPAADTATQIRDHLARHKVVLAPAAT